MAGRLKEFLKKYGKVGLGVHFSVSAASITGIYVAIKNNVDVEAMLGKIGMPTGISNKNGADSDVASNPVTTDELNTSVETQTQAQSIQHEVKPRNRTAELVASTGGALTLAVLLNKALFPVRVPITIALTPAIARQNWDEIRSPWNNPLYIQSFTEAEDALKLHHIVHCSLDVVEERVNNPKRSGPTLNETFLGLLYPTENYKVYGYLTNTKVKFIMVTTDLDVRDADVRNFFRRFHAAYVDAVSNPFHVPGKKITSRNFADSVSSIVKSFGLNPSG
ncbi:membrane traffic protein [Lithospermum erythrorhizon]|uniref:Trafficking protein particle complex subunit 2-like protein n=1 Tax=Lithospermum erythrorhizon TaxID=34254 RepID=A0AAV3QTQ7_LITER